MESPTSGNWIVDFGEGDWPLIFSEDGVLVADPMLTDEAAETDPGKIVANAYMMAASPTMKEALKSIETIFGPQCWSGCKHKKCIAVSLARAAIARAEGRE